MGDWEALGYDGPTREIVTPNGRIIDVDVIEPETRLHAAGKAADFLYPKRKAIELSATFTKETKLTLALNWGDEGARQPSITQQDPPAKALTREP